jgi:sec-independent protein translocase protein TatC
MSRRNNQKISDKKPFLDHLEDLRITIIKILITLGIATGLSLIFTSKLLYLLKFPLIMALNSMGQGAMEKEILRSMAPAGAFTLSLKMALFAGLAFALPPILYFLTRFILPGLNEKEKKYLPLVFLFGAALFALGILFCYWIALPQSLKFLWRYNEFMGILPLWTIESYISFVIFFMLAFGLAFETPLLILSLVKLDLLSPMLLREKRRHAIVVIIIVAAVLTPPDVFSQILLAIPMIFLYEICIWISSWIKPQK